MRIGIVCGYSFDVPGGVQFHVRDLAEHLIATGHDVSVLAPAEDATPVPDYLVPAGRTVALPYNGSVARLNFGPVAAARTRRWLEEGDFDVLHLHEPITPSLSMLALWIANGPIVGTFHTAMDRSRALQVASPLVRPLLEKIGGRIAVSEEARRTVVEHLGGDAVVVPNGVFVDRFADAPRAEAWCGTDERPTVAFLGRLDEARKGLPVLAEAIPQVLAQVPGARFLVAGRGDVTEYRSTLGHLGDAVTFLGPVSDAEKESLLASADVYVAPHTGGESFGIVLVEAMSAGAHVVASDIPAFRAVLDGGRYGTLFPTGDAAALAAALVPALRDRGASRSVVEAAREGVRRFDWSVVTREVLAVYEMVTASGAHVREDPRSSTVVGRLRAALDGRTEVEQ
ncbi:Phosphatidylinositol alpha-mannosyltransferase [Georgenia satyanarayanai]|uniref:D-inositol 3-phosphate glycosyltransferase n=1 Tax=Georgenia satyanarayanai TaxID=860221 RepID=A0A2Y8ZY14_9MICO|nr:glycosyltransferase family 4 protein [Georgenia satyanarayanai]PYG02074.1 phosphatidylinositol alpha-mannosyltransferase [Georgenia satyanarayanai]SSA36885.1 Phosphatidylinositol alpha-mannosyltransferase [Georgenia satyanarayanai]